MSELSSASMADILGFMAVAQTSSFTAAAARLGTNKSSVGKAVQRLEKHLGTRLFQRTTRAVHLTEDGEIYLAAARAATARLQEAEQTLAANRAEPAGRVRIDLPAGFGRLMLPALHALRARYPKVIVEMALSDRMSDPVGEGWDIVVRIGHPAGDSDMTVRKIADQTLGLYAAPSYLEHRGPVTSIAQLHGHDAVLFRSSRGKLYGWSVNDNGVRRELAPAPVLILADGHAFVEAAAMGMGVAQIMDRFASPFVAAGRLVHLLPEADVAAVPVYALIPGGHPMAARTRVVLEHLVATLQPDQSR
jgi:DNA-binding transcriptional LysR family regulator